MTQESTAQGNTTPYWVIAGVLVLAILAVAGWKLKQFLSPPSVATAVIEPDCNLHEGRCNASFADGTQVSLTISPHPIPLLKPLTLESNVEGVDASKVEVDIVGINMNMGYIRPQLQNGEGGTNFTGESILPVCILNEMEWEARVMVHAPDGLRIAPFRFKTQKQ